MSSQFGYKWRQIQAGNQQWISHTGSCKCATLPENPQIKDRYLHHILYLKIAI